MSETASNAQQHADNLKRFGDIETRLDTQDDSLDVMNRKLDRLLLAVVGDENTGTTGLVKRMAAAETRMGKVEVRHIFFTGIIATLSALFSGLAAWWEGHGGK